MKAIASGENTPSFIERSQLRLSKIAKMEPQEKTNEVQKFLEYIQENRRQMTLEAELKLTAVACFLLPEVEKEKLTPYFFNILDNHFSPYENFKIKGNKGEFDKWMSIFKQTHDEFFDRSGPISFEEMCIINHQHADYDVSCAIMSSWKHNQYTVKKETDTLEPGDEMSDGKLYIGAPTQMFITPETPIRLKFDTWYSAMNPPHGTHRVPTSKELNAIFDMMSSPAKSSTAFQLTHAFKEAHDQPFWINDLGKDITSEHLKSKGRALNRRTRAIEHIDKAKNLPCFFIKI